jgi:hypothetical protein
LPAAPVAGQTVSGLTPTFVGISGGVTPWERTLAFDLDGIGDKNSSFAKRYRQIRTGLDSLRKADGKQVGSDLINFPIIPFTHVRMGRTRQSDKIAAGLFGCTRLSKHLSKWTKLDPSNNLRFLV